MNKMSKLEAKKYLEKYKDNLINFYWEEFDDYFKLKFVFNADYYMQNHNKIEKDLKGFNNIIYGFENQLPHYYFRPNFFE